MLKPNLILAVLVCVCIPALAYSQTYQCKNADGTVRFTDQPCPESLGKPKVDSDSETWKTVLDLNSKKNVSAEEVDQLMLRYDKNYKENKKRCDDRTLKGCEEYFSTLGKMNSDIRKACTKTGDISSCKIACGGSEFTGILDEKQAPADDFLACAKALELKHGDFWLLHKDSRGWGPEARRSPAGEIILPYNKYTKPLDEGRQIGGYKLRMLCFRKRKSASEVEADNNFVQEIHYVTSRANDQVIRLAYSIDTSQYDSLIKKPITPEFPTLQDLANNICPK